MRDLKNKSTFLTMICKPAPAHCMSTPQHCICAPMGSQPKSEKRKNVNREQNTHKKTPPQPPQNRNKNSNSGLHAKMREPRATRWRAAKPRRRRIRQRPYCKVHCRQAANTIEGTRLLHYTRQSRCTATGMLFPIVVHFLGEGGVHRRNPHWWKERRGSAGSPVMTRGGTRWRRSVLTARRTGGHRTLSPLCLDLEREAVAVFPSPQ